MFRNSKKLLSVMLAIVTMIGIAIPAHAASISDGKSSTVTVQSGNRNTFLTLSTGNMLGGMSWSYTTNDGIAGPAYCIDWGLSAPSSTKQLAIKGKYTSSPKTMGAFANGYPQLPLEDFLDVYKSYSELAGLIVEEYAYATQVAVWASLGQLGVEGTAFTAGRSTVKRPSGDAQQVRIFKAIEIILQNANTWTKPQYSGMYVRGQEAFLGGDVSLPDKTSLEKAALTQIGGIRKETIGGIEYFTRQYWGSSSTSTYFNDYFIDVWAESAPAGTIFVNASNSPLATATSQGRTVYKLPTTYKTTNLNSNGYEYSGTFKICLPVSNVADVGNVTIRNSSSVRQYNIYLVDNPTATEQSYIIADPGKTDLYALGSLKWNATEATPGLASVVVTKIDGTGNPLEGARFTLRSSDGSTKTGTSDFTGRVTWSDLDPALTYTLEETQAPLGYRIVDPMNVAVAGDQTSYVTVRNDTDHTIRILKIDAQNGYPLRGAVFNFKQINGSYQTTAITGHDGMIYFAGKELPYGSYEVTEIQAPTGYKRDTKTQAVNWDGSADVTLTFKNVREPGITIVKTDERGIPLTGARFNVYKDGKLVTSVAVNSNGMAYVNGLSTGYYEVEETVAPAGFKLDSTRHGIYVDPYDPALKDDPVLTIVNKVKPSLRILKYDAQTMRPLGSCVFEVYHDATLIGTYTTDSYGEILLSGLTPGTYLAKEIAAPGTHVVNSSPQQIELNAGDTETAVLVFLNQLKPGIHLIKLDSETMKPLVNATYKIKLIGGSYEKEFTADQNGEIDLTSLTPGAYQVSEIKAPTGYLIDDGIRTVQINAGENALFVFTDSKKPSIEVVKYDPVTGKYLSGATFRIAKIEDGSHYLDRVTDTQGKIRIDDLEPGIYSVTEIAAPAGYVLNATEYHVELFPGKTSQLVVINEKKPDLLIRKTDAITGKPIEGVQFTVNKADSSTLTTVTTDARGECLMTSLDPGVYTVREKSVPDGYLLDDTPQQITLVPNSTGTVEFKNYPKPTLTISKIDSVTKDPISGAKFHITYASNNTFTGEINDLGDFNTDENGKIVVDKLRDGWYRIKEMAPASGYSIKQPDTQDIFVKSGESKSVIFENTPLSALIVRKVDNETGSPVAGAWFRVRYLGGTSGTGGTIIHEGVTSANGTITLTGLKAGTYIVEEYKAAPGYELSNPSSQTAYLSGNDQDVVTVVFGNSRMGNLIIKKLDSITKQPIKGVTFKVTDSSGSVIGPNNGEYVTDASGLINLAENLPVGSTVVVQEIGCPAGYIMDSTTQTVKIKENSTHPLTFYNTPTGGLQIRKYDAVTRQPLKDAVFKVTDSSGAVVGVGNGLYTTDKDGAILIPGLKPGTYVVTETRAPDGYLLGDKAQTIQIKDEKLYTLEFVNTPLPGLQVLKLDEETRKPIANVEFRISRMNGEILGTYRTDSNGIITLPGLADGWYSAVETKSAGGYLLDAAPHNIELKAGVTAVLTVTNRKASNILIHKVDSVTGKGIYGVTFLISDENHNPIRTVTSDQNGYVFTTGLPDGKYFIREIEAAKGYIQDTTIKTFYVTYGATSEIEWKNTPTMGQIQITKKSSDDNPINGFPKGSLLQGAVFEIYDRANNLVDTVTSDRNGLAVSRTLPLGRYTVREVKAPAYYLATQETVSAEIEFSGQIIRLEVLNQSVYTNVSVAKRGYTEVVPGQQLRYDFKSIANNSTVALDSFYWRDTLPTDAVRLQKIATGSWSARLSYKIVYKTNLSGGSYRTLMDNLSTDKIYAIDASPAALGLASNEFVTEFMFVFGRVPAGFKQVEAPYIYCQVLQGLTHEYRFTNKTDVGGLWGNQWIMANDRWVTVVYNKTTPPKLPRTGY